MFKGWAVLLSILAVTFAAEPNFAQDTSEPSRSMVIQVKKSLPLSRAEAPRKDFYLNVGARQGVQPGWIYPVYRRAAIHDPFFNLSKGDLLVHVADLQVYHVEDQVSVAKVHAYTDPNSRPILDEPAIMVGDAFGVKQGRKPAAAAVGSAPVAPVSSSASVAAGLSPEKALEVLESYQKASAPEPPAQETPSGSLFVEEDPNLQAPVQMPQTL